MQAVRSPSMVASSMRQSADHSKLFSIRDFERAVVKLRNKNERKSSIAHSTPVVEPEADAANLSPAINGDDASGESSGAESGVGSSQEKDIDELHTTTETTEHSQGQSFCSLHATNFAHCQCLKIKFFLKNRTYQENLNAFNHHFPAVAPV